jgi:hypothetical protein
VKFENAQDRLQDRREGIGKIRLIGVPQVGIKEVVMAKVIEFYIPESFGIPMKWALAIERGKIIEFCPQMKKSAWCLFLEVCHELDTSFCS